MCFYKANGRPCKHGANCSFSHTREALAAHKKKFNEITFQDDLPIRDPVKLQRPSGLKPRLSNVDFPPEPSPDAEHDPPDMPEHPDNSDSSSEQDEFDGEYDAYCLIAATADFPN